MRHNTNDLNNSVTVHEGIWLHLVISLFHLLIIELLNYLSNYPFNPFDLKRNELILSISTQFDYFIYQLLSYWIQLSIQIFQFEAKWIHSIHFNII